MSPDDIAAAYQRDGYCFPIEVMSPREAADYRRRLQQVECAGPGRPAFGPEHRSHGHHVLPMIDEIMRRREILDPVARILGPDLLVWGTTLFIKEARSPQFISWHQDLTYWGLDDTEEVTAWVALSPANVASGCMRFVPGSHRQAIVAHRDTFAAENLLSRGQEIAVEVDEARAVDAVLGPGQMSLHHGRTFHASHPNRADDRRIGLAIRYITPAMRQVGGVRTVAVLVRGTDRHGHFELAPPPSGLMTESGLAQRQRAADLLKPILYA